MARSHPDLPTKVPRTILRKREIFSALAEIDGAPDAKARVLRMETDFRQRIDSHIASLPAASAQFQKFYTSPFVLMFYSRQQGYHHVIQIEKDIVPAKVFSSMETSAGRMVETVVLPVYGWETVQSAMHSVKSCPEMAKSQARTKPSWLPHSRVGRDASMTRWRRILALMSLRTPHLGPTPISTHIEFTYGVLYGTKKQSNKKDWHILRNVAAALPDGSAVTSWHGGAWSIAYSQPSLNVSATVKVGIEWWDYLGGPNTWLELCVALIRACIAPSTPQNAQQEYVISDLAEIYEFSVTPARL